MPFKRVCRMAVVASDGSSPEVVQKVALRLVRKLNFGDQAKVSIHGRRRSSNRVVVIETEERTTLDSIANDLGSTKPELMRLSDGDLKELGYKGGEKDL